MSSLLPGVIYWRDGQRLAAAGLWAVVASCFALAVAPFFHPIIGPSLVESITYWFTFHWGGSTWSDSVWTLTGVLFQICELFIAWLVLAISLWSVRERVQWQQANFWVRVWCGVCCPGLPHVLAGKNRSGRLRFTFFAIALATALAPLMIVKTTFWSSPLGWMSTPTADSASESGLLDPVLSSVSIGLAALTLCVLAEAVRCAFKPSQAPSRWPKGD